MGRPNTTSSRLPRMGGSVVAGLAVGTIALTLAVGACGSLKKSASPSTTVTAATTMAPTPTTEAPTTTINPATLPQTDTKPAATGEGFDLRMQALAAAIIAGDSAKGLSSFFPVEAYKQVKKNTDPAADWKNRLIAAFGVDTRDANKLLGTGAANATFLGADVPNAAVWVKPGEEYNLIGYWRVYGTKLRFDVGGSIKVVPVSSLISWRGEWYVVHLGAIR
ncbi:MAG: hypothetical protein F2520_00335 [Actinobacteria bacterium]|uniref:Unannotated protein n=1 Tax=freshwater metagenome TaxID=449393 RepID=A0A6J7HFZ8_9ZZZZ|nr:hypothetical protein [Actinomycetota bacterium]MTA76685.1 hypothetical protein [Actinomycetota bacterium]